MQNNRNNRYKRDERSNLEKALEDPRVKDRYLKEAEKLFMGTKGRPEHSKDLIALHNSYGTDKFLPRVKHYVDTYGMPSDWSSLLLLLDLKKESEIVCKAIEALGKLIKEKKLIERNGLKSKLRVLALTTTDPEILATAEMQLAEIS